MTKNVITKILNDMQQIFSGIITFTIKNDCLRKYIRDAIKKDLEGVELDQSTYGIHCAGMCIKEYHNKIKMMISVAKESCNENFSIGDKILWCRATNSDDHQRDRIQVITILE